MQAPLVHKDRIFLGIAYCIAAHFLFSLMSVGGKYLFMVEGYHPIEIAFFRNLVVFIPMMIAIVAFRRFDLFKTRRPFIMGFRSFTAALCLICIFTSMALLPMSYATVIFFTSSLITPVIAVLFLGESMGRHRWLAVFFGMSGVLLIAQPAGEVSALGLFFAACTACLFSTQHTTLRVLKAESPLTIIIYLVIGGLIVQGALLPWFSNGFRWEHAWIIILIGFFASSAQFCLSNAYKHAPTSVVTPFGYSGLLWATLFDVFFWKYGNIDYVMMGGGAALIIAAQLYMMHREYMNGKTVGVRQDV